ncbi:MAG: tetratricopeptide repeat protein, partial [Deltaproteobacteria bacterium]|nr:tetratricopeptide repeat protein [Deltaproteobacteria bacterium]
GKEAAGKEAAGKEEKGKGEKGKGEKGKGEKGKGEKGKEDGSESEAEPRGFDSLMSKADRLRKDDKCGKALEYYHKAAELKPGYAEVQYKLGDCYRRTGRCSAAVKHYEQAISASGFQQAYIGVAKCYIEMGDKGAAKKRLEEGLKRHDDGIMKMMIEQL